MISKLHNQFFFTKERQKIKPNGFKTFVKTELKKVPKKNFFNRKDKEKIVIEGQSGKISILEICEKEGISLETFHQWTNEFLTDSENSFSTEVIPVKKKFSTDQRFKIVIEGKLGEISISEICNRESISHNTFLEWSEEFLNFRNRESNVVNLKNSVFYKNRELVSRIVTQDVYEYLKIYFDFTSEELLIILKSNSLKLDKVDQIKSVIGFQKINDVRYINKHFEKINSILQDGGIYAGCLETFSAQRNRMAINKIPVINNIYYSFEFLFKRVLPKLSLSKKYYFDITKGNDRLLSKAEGLGRLVSCGFRIMDHKSIDGKLYFVVKKVGDPTYDTNPSYGPIYKMPRLGKNGKIIGVYKFRTMHPYSEYLQDYVINVNGYADSGKPADDFRIPAWGKFMRRFWLDEIPQLLNVLKGELKLVGIRPVSKRYFQDIPKEMQKLRLTQKPGCIPPYVALDRDGNVMSVLQAEKDYLEEKIQYPYFTDTKYFFKAVFNIIFKHKRSA